MSSILNSYLIEPALRQARRFSSPPAPTLSQSHAIETEHALAVETDDDDPVQLPERGAEPSERGAESSPTPLNALTELHGQTEHDAEDETYGEEDDRNRSTMDVAASQRDPSVTHENRLQISLPLDDVRSNYVFDEEPMASPDAMVSSAGEAITPASGAIHTSSGTDRRTVQSFRSMTLDEAPSMTSNPSHTAPLELRSTVEENALTTVRDRLNERMGNDTQATPSRQSSSNSVMSEHLPADDGMNDLRLKMHKIQEMALSAEEKAQRMHNLMTEDYRKLRQDSVQSVTMSEASNGDPGFRRPHPLRGDGAMKHRSPSPMSDSENEALESVTEKDKRPTYQPRQLPDNTVTSPTSPTSAVSEDSVLGCAHYLRNVKVQCDDCWKWYTCRFCHDEAQTHVLNRTRIRHMLCMQCGRPQKAAEYCIDCGLLTASYYCNICKLWDNDPSHSIYHCSDCGICRRGEGLGKDYVHCKRCNVCINIAYATSHRCIERATECNCPICGEWMFTSSITVVAVQCGHYMHRPCHDELMRTSFKCPICNRSAVNMELQWRKLDHAIEAQPMPSQFKLTKVWIICNDCSARSCTSFHWLGNKCTVCDSYNTNQVKMINSPSDQELQAMTESRELQALREAERRLESVGATATFSPTARRQSEIDLAAASRRPSAPAAEPSPTRRRSEIDLVAASRRVSALSRRGSLTGTGPSRPAFLAMTAINPPAQRPTISTTSAPANHGRRPVTPQTASNPELASYSAPSLQAATPSQSYHGSFASQEDVQMTDSDSDLASIHSQRVDSARPPDSAVTDDLSFWGDGIGTPGWQLPSVGVPRVPDGWPRVPDGWPRMAMPSISDAWPRMPQMPQMPQMPSMPRADSYWPRMPSMPEGWQSRIPTMPNVSMPSLGMAGIGVPISMSMNVMPRAISPSTIWAAGSPVFSGLNLPSPRYFATRRGRAAGGADGDEDEEEEDGDYDEDGEEESSSSSEEGMEWDRDGDGEEDGDVDELELFGHR